jgi:hypothetical protein
MKRTTILTFFASTLFLVVPLGSTIGNSPLQRVEQKKCPTIEVKGPRRRKGSKAIIYRARIKNLPSGARRIFNWSIEGAEILTGQGTDSIKVQPFGGEVRATVMVESRSECEPTQASRVTEVTYIVGCSLPPFINAVELAPSSIVRPCSEGKRSETCAATGNLVEVTADAPEDAPHVEFLFTWSVTAGRLISSEGRRVTWDLSGVPKGTYTVTVEMNDGNQHTATASATLTVSDCTDCKPSN